jgi:hypothetical protein
MAAADAQIDSNCQVLVPITGFISSVLHKLCTNQLTNEREHNAPAAVADYMLQALLASQPALLRKTLQSTSVEGSSHDACCGLDSSV